MVKLRTTLRRHCCGFLLSLTVVVALIGRCCGNQTETNIDLNDPKIKQRIKIWTAQQACAETISKLILPADGGIYCPPVWDNLLCWPEFVPPGHTVSQQCPPYIAGFNPEEYAVRHCTENGTWEEHPDPNITHHYTDFERCTAPYLSTVIKNHMPIVNKISTVGYSLSLAFLLLATAMMICFKKLHCQRNTIHIHLFLSFILRAAISILKNILLVDGFALPADIDYSEDGRIIFTQDSAHWECKLLNTLWIYALCANYFWIFVEGFYLHNLILFTYLSQAEFIFKVYILIGWGLPLVFVNVWVLTRINFNDVLCWNTHEKGFYWIIEGPIAIVIAINFFFFLNIIRILFTKIRDCNTKDPRRYKKLAKSTLVLIPMFGVIYIVFIILNFYREPEIAVVHMYLEMTVNSFQGIIIAMLFCFLNGEVQSEIHKRWYRHRLRRLSVTSGRSSRAMSTVSSNAFSRDRPSICMTSLNVSVTCPGPSLSPNDETNTITSPSMEIELASSNYKKHLGHNEKDVPVKNSALNGQVQPSSSSKSLNESLPRVPSASKVTFQENEPPNSRIYLPPDHQNRIDATNSTSEEISGSISGILRNGPSSREESPSQRPNKQVQPFVHSPKGYTRLSSLTEELAVNGGSKCEANKGDDGDFDTEKVIRTEMNRLLPLHDFETSDETAPMIDLWRST